MVYVRNAWDYDPPFGDETRINGLLIETLTAYGKTRVIKMSTIMKEVPYLTTLIFKAFKVTLRTCVLLIKANWINRYFTPTVGELVVFVCLPVFCVFWGDFVFFSLSFPGRSLLSFL